ncbi:hypothetical protein HZA33_01025 [Candidatus Pacearchaeota archaeon]|nr:hypothetical protein [Candidatus Pacearchaeota archaeon]
MPKKEIKRKEHKEKVEVKEKKGDPQEKQIVFIVVFMVFAIAAVVGFSYMYKNAGNFRYNDLYFQKTRVGELIVYKTDIMITNQFGQVKYSLFLRNDPRRIKIPVDATISLKTDVFITFDPEISKCYASNLASYNLGSLLGTIGVNVKGATMSQELANEKNLPYATCNEATNKTVIEIKRVDAGESSITQKGNCYELNVANCQVVETTERFMLELVNQIIKRSKFIA